MLYSYRYSIPYIIVYLFLCILFFRNQIGEFPGNKSNLKCFILILMFWGCRGYIGWDWMAYYPMFKAVDSLWNFSSQSFILVYSNDLVSDIVEPGFILYMSIIKSLFNNYHVFIFITSFIVLLSIGKFINKYSDNYILSFIIFFAIYQSLMVDLLRNSLALAIFLFTISSKKDMKIISIIGLSIIGFSFHRTYLMLVPLYFLRQIKISKKLIWLLFIIGNILLLCHIPISRIAIDTVLPFFGNNIIAQKLLNYSTSDVYGATMGVTFGYIFRLGIFLLIMSKYDELCKDLRYRIIVNAYVIYALIYFCMRDMSILVERTELLYCFPIIILYPRLSDVIKRKYKKIYLYIILIFCLFRLYASTNDIMYKYVTCFNRVTYEEQYSQKKPMANILMEK